MSARIKGRVELYPYHGEKSALDSLLDIAPRLGATNNGQGSEIGCAGNIVYDMRCHHITDSNCCTRSWTHRRSEWGQRSSCSPRFVQSSLPVQSCQRKPSAILRRGCDQWVPRRGSRTAPFLWHACPLWRVRGHG